MFLFVTLLSFLLFYNGLILYLHLNNVLANFITLDWMCHILTKKNFKSQVSLVLVVANNITNEKHNVLAMKFHKNKSKTKKKIMLFKKSNNTEAKTKEQ